MIKSVSAILAVLLSVLMVSITITPTGLEVNNEVTYETSSEFLHAYQFWNENPMGMGNTTLLNESGLLHLEIKNFFHDIGNLTITVLMDDEIIFKETFRNETAWRSISVSQGMIMQTIADSGYHDPEETPIGDFYVVYAKIETPISP